MKSISIKVQLLTHSVILSCLLLLGCEQKIAVPYGPAELSAEDIRLNNRGVALMGRFEYAAARAVFYEAVERKPTWLDAKVNLAIATLNRQNDGDEELAFRYINEVLAEDSNHLRAHFVAGLLTQRAGEFEKALMHFQTIADRDPEDAYASYYLAVLVQNDDPQRAISLFKKSIELDPYLRSAYYGAFLLLARSGDEEASLAMKDDYELLANNPRARLVETKYTRMGVKANALAIDDKVPEKFVLPQGELFDSPLEVAALDGRQKRTLSLVDLQNNGLLDLFLTDEDGFNQLFVAENGEYQSLDDHPILTSGSIRAIAWGDIDNNGFPDAVVCSGQTGVIGTWFQSPDNQWERSNGLHELIGESRTCHQLMLLDADHDGDLDVYVAFAKGGRDLFSNNGNNSFRSLTAESKLSSSAGRGVSLAATDLDNDRDTDLIVLNSGRHGNEVLVNDRLWNYFPVRGMDNFLEKEMLTVVPADLNADGQIELYAIGAEGALLQWHKKNSGDWISRSIATVNVSMPPELAVDDFNGDGNLDVLIVDGDGIRILHIEADSVEILFQHVADVATAVSATTDPIRGPSLFALVNTDDGQSLMHWRPGMARGKFLTLSFTGQEEKSESMRSNRSGIGTQVAVRRGSEWTITDTLDHHSGASQSLQPLAIGLGGHDDIDYVAVEWSDGVFQTELDLAAGQAHRITETQRQLSSCPVLFAWDGEEWAFVSDVLGVGGIGFLHSPGEYSTPRPWEYFQLPARALVPRDGRLEIKITEPMEEIAMIDEVKLWAVDLPPGLDMVLDERMGTGGPTVTGTSLFFRNELTPAKVTRDDGMDLTQSLANVDKIAADLGETHSRYLGRLKESRSITLEFKQPLNENNGSVVLVADGWVEYPYSQTVFAAWQANEFYESPTLEASGDDGVWSVVYPNFGYPAGMPRRMALPLNGLPKDTTRLRISSNLEIYWDRISVVFAIDAGENVLKTQLPLKSAIVSQNGYPKRTNGPQRRPHYDYGKRKPFWDSRYPKGNYTHLGEAMPLAMKQDGAYIIVGPGEEVHLSFANLADPRDGWTRHYILYTSGYAKDMDMYTQDSGTVGPLPIPDNANIRLHDSYNTRYRDGY